MPSIGGTGYSSSASSPYATNLPTVTVNGSLFIVAIAVSATDRTLTPSATGVTFAALPGFHTMSSTGHQVRVWYAILNTADSGKSMSWTTTGGTVLKVGFVWLLEPNPHPSDPFNVVLAQALTTAGTSKTTPSGTTDEPACYEVQIVSDNRGSTTPPTDDWTKPAAMTASHDVFAGGTTALTSIAIGYNATPLADNAPVGGDTWNALHTTGTVASSAVGTAWTLAIRTNAALPTTDYTRRDIVEIVHTGDGVASLTQIGGTAVLGITEGPTGTFEIELPAEFTDVLTFDLEVTEGGITVNEGITVSSGGIIVARYVKHPTLDYI